jgi:signal transduction histidine kinase
MELHGSGCRHLEGGDRVARRRSKRGRGSREKLARLLEIVSHDLRSPLAAISAHSDNLLDGIFGEISGEAKKRIRQIRRIAGSGSRMVEELLAVAGPIAGKPCRDPAAALTEVAASLRLSAPPRSVRLELRAPRGFPSLPLPRALLQAAVRNLAENALRASPRTGTVRIEARREKGHVRIQVADRGKWTGAVWGDDAPRREGIGLRIVREIVEEHGGEGFSNPRRGGGSLVGFQIPYRGSGRRGARTGKR